MTDPTPFEVASLEDFPPSVWAARAIAKRPGMYVGTDWNYGLVVAWICGYEHAINEARYAGAYNPGGFLTRLQERLREQGRLRWESWDLTLLAEAINWTGDQRPTGHGLSIEQEGAAVAHLIGEVEDLFQLPYDPDRYTTGD